MNSGSRRLWSTSFSRRTGERVLFVRLSSEGSLDFSVRNPYSENAHLARTHLMPTGLTRILNEFPVLFRGDREKALWKVKTGKCVTLGEMR